LACFASLILFMWLGCGRSSCLRISFLFLQR
jgi:hypothetical protein